ncbi:hypothetical protein ACHABX_05515 [Nesterenkonia halotolerans]|uniref:hypothetical protein n=1 Tax=Nesterenkonia halotolerans TaxID=225325 RepID=UPI003EE74A90
MAGFMVSVVLALVVNAVLDATTDVALAIQWSIAVFASPILTWVIQRPRRSRPQRSTDVHLGLRD